jgi:hypothetical protein
LNLVFYFVLIFLIFFCFFLFPYLFDVDDVEGMMTLLGSLCRILNNNQKVLFRCALAQFFLFGVMLKYDIVSTKGEYDYAKYDGKVGERLKEGELPNSGGTPNVLSKEAVESVHTFLQNYSSPYQKKVRRSLS